MFPLPLSSTSAQVNTSDRWIAGNVGFRFYHSSRLTSSSGYLLRVRYPTSLLVAYTSYRIVIIEKTLNCRTSFAPMHRSATPRQLDHGLAHPRHTHSAIEGCNFSIRSSLPPITVLSLLFFHHYSSCSLPILLSATHPQGSS